MAVPLLDLNQQNGALEEELQAAFTRVFRSGYYILGSEVEAFEAEAARAIGAKHAIGVSSGTDAILLALMALDIGPGDEVICPTFTFFATAGCVARTGAKPVFVDSEPTGFNLDPTALESRITSRTKAIMPVHLFGQTADMTPVMEVAERHGIRVIEDAAQAIGAEDHGRGAGTIGCFGAFSFFPSKNLGCLGDAGLLTCQDGKLAEKARVLRVHGMQPKYYHKWIGANFRIDALQAAFLRVKLPHLPDYQTKRAENAGHYLAALAPLAEDGRLILPRAAEGKTHTWNQFTLRVPPAGNGENRRDALKAHLLGKQIGCEIYYPLALHQQECFASVITPEERYPHAETLAQECLSIPVFPELSPGQREEVVSAIHGFFRDTD